MRWAVRARRIRRQRGRTVSNRTVRLAGSFLSAFALLLQGCYTTLPLEQGAPPTSVSVQLLMNDKGRLDVSQKLGSAVDKVEGVVTAQTSDSYTLAVSRVFQIGGAVSKWNGETVTISKDGTNGYQVHTYSKAKNRHSCSSNHRRSCTVPRVSQVDRKRFGFTRNVRLSNVPNTLVRDLAL